MAGIRVKVIVVLMMIIIATLHEQTVAPVIETLHEQAVALATDKCKVVVVVNQQYPQRKQQQQQTHHRNNHCNSSSAISEVISGERRGKTAEITDTRQERKELQEQHSYKPSLSRPKARVQLR